MGDYGIRSIYIYDTDQIKLVFKRQIKRFLK